MSEEAKIGVRNARHEAMEKIKAMHKKEEITEDQQKGAEKKIQEKVDHINKEIDEAAKQKEADVMKV